MKTLVSCVLAILLLPIGPLRAQTRDFGGMHFGVGLSLTYDLGHHDRVIDAMLDENAIVRITNQNDAIPRIVLETHYFFADSLSACGCGPFVAIQPGTDQIIKAIGVGGMVGFKKDVKANGNDSWNIGLGFVFDPNTKILGDGVEENKPLPTGETNIRFKVADQIGIILVFSFAF